MNFAKVDDPVFASLTPIKQKNMHIEKITWMLLKKICHTGNAAKKYKTNMESISSNLSTRLAKINISLAKSTVLINEIRMANLKKLTAPEDANQYIIV